MKNWFLIVRAVLNFPSNGIREDHINMFGTDQDVVKMLPELAYASIVETESEEFKDMIERTGYSMDFGDSRDIVCEFNGTLKVFELSPNGDIIPRKDLIDVAKEKDKKSFLGFKTV